MILFHSNIYNDKKYYKYLGIENGRVCYIGNKKINNISKIIDYSEYYIYPAFIDAHTHLIYHGLNLLRPSLVNVEKEQEIYEIIMDYYKKHRDIEFIIAEGFDESKFKKQILPDVNILNQLFPNIPVIIRRICGHIGIVNKKAANLMIHFGGNYNKETGIFSEGAMLRLNEIFDYNFDYKKRAINMAIDDLLSYGITTIGDFFTKDALSVYKSIKPKIDIKGYIVYDKDIDFRTVNAHFHNMEIKGIKVFLDGSIGGYTAAFSKNYKYKNIKGKLLFNNNQLKHIKNIAEKYNLQMSAHAIGDISIKQAIDILQSEDRIEHFEFPNKKDIIKVKRKNIYLCIQPNFIGNWGNRNGMYEKRLIKKIFYFNNPVQYIVNKNIALGFGSDDMPASPVYGLYSIINAPFDYQRIDFHKAFELYTKGSAYIMNLTDIGSLNKNKQADFFITRKKINLLKKNEIPYIIHTYKKGIKIYSRGSKC